MTKQIRTYCGQCYNNCPVVAHVENDTLVKVTPDKNHIYYRPICPKGIAGPELIYNEQRIIYPMMRTRPKGDNDPGWVRISWDEALDSIAHRLAQIKKVNGPEAIAINQSFAGSPLWEIGCYLRRFSNLLGTPNIITTTHICNWHRDFASSLTFAKPGVGFQSGWPEFEKSKCILILGNNPETTLNSFHWKINNAHKSGAKLIVVDPRKTSLASQADLWLQVKPGTDGALILSIIHIILTENRYDLNFVRDWTNAPLLVRMDTGSLLKGKDLGLSADENTFVVLDAETEQPKLYRPGARLLSIPLLEGEITVQISKQAITCKTVFQLLKKAAEQYHPDRVTHLTGVDKNQLREASRLITQHKPACWYSYNGVEQSFNATQTNRAICILYALTGDFDKSGGNALLSPFPPLNYPYGFEFATQDMFQKNLALHAHPLGPAGTIMSVPPYLAYEAILNEKPYPLKALLCFGGNLAISNPDSNFARKALQKLDFQVNVDLFINPTANFANIVLPAASFWEVNRLGYIPNYQGNESTLQWRPAVVQPQGESRDDLWIIFQLAKRLGFDNQFWHGNIEASFEHQLKPLNITLAELKKAPGGILIKHDITYQKYKTQGFANLTGRVEIFSQPLKNIGQAPLPDWQDPYIQFSDRGWTEQYPLILITAKLKEFCHTQNRSMPSLRKQHPHPFLEINDRQAAQLNIQNGDWVTLETVQDAITLKAKISPDIAYNVVCTQHGWWQSCPTLKLPNYDPFSAAGANVNLLFNNELRDPVSGSIQVRGFPCSVKKKAGHSQEGIKSK
ncbi:MAG: molybdopterin oxidoreductase [Firmicutes bacterium]|nr:molybdopterin oxidoreductase [Bacillota bacterium]